MNLDRKKLFWTVLFIAILCVLFWFLSRYSAHDSKAIMEGSINFEGIGFDQIVSVPPDASVLERNLANTVNWMETRDDLATGELKLLENNGKTKLILAPAFADIDRNASLDIYSGNWSVGMMGDRNRGFVASINYLTTDPLNDSLKKVVQLQGPAGETLTTLFSDFDHDGIQDLIVGNDFNMPELFYRGIGNGKFHLITKAEGIVPVTTQNCMSIDAIDLDNDLVNEYFMAGSASKNLPSNTFQAADAGICEEITDPEERKQCEQIMDLHERIGTFRKTKEIQYCPAEFKEDCIALDLLTETTQFLEGSDQKEYHLCDFIPSNSDWSFMQNICAFDRTDTVRFTLTEKRNSIPSIRNESVLLQRNSNKAFSNTAEEYQVDATGWSWNAQFADFNNDGFADLFVATGSFHDFTREPNHVYQNNGGTGFTDIAEQTGLNSYLPSYSYVYTDFDNDGDLDIIMPPAVGPIQFYENLSASNNSIAIELDDAVGNRQGIGSQITILYGEGKQQVREIKTSGGYRSFNSAEAWFGLGTFESVERITVQWSTGEKQIIEGPFSAGNRYIIHRKK